MELTGPSSKTVGSYYDLANKKPDFIFLDLLVIKFKMFQNPIQAVLPPDQADLVLIMLLIGPLSYVLSLIYNKFLFLAMTMTLTMGFQSILFPNDKWVLWVQQQVVYLLVIFAPRKYVGHIVIVECFSAVVWIHLRRMYVSYG